MAAENILGKSLMDRIEWLECLHNRYNELNSTYWQTTVRETYCTREFLALENNM